MGDVLPLGAGALKFSTDEQIVGEWIDGKPLYSKTFDFGNLSNVSSKVVAHNITNLDKIVWMFAQAVESNTYFYPIPFVHDQNVTLQINFSSDRTNITIINRGRDCTGIHAYATLFLYKNN